MGYYIQQQDTNFLIKAENKAKALKAIKGLIGQETIGDHFSWVSDFSQMTSFEEAMECWRWIVEVNNVGDVNCVYFHGQKLGDDELLFKTIAPFVESGSHIEMRGEAGEIWRWVFDGKDCNELIPTITWGQETTKKQTIHILVSGGMVQATRSTIDIDVEVFDRDIFYKEGYSAEKIYSMWEDNTINTNFWT